jgi:hypothetical protein
MNAVWLGAIRKSITNPSLLVRTLEKILKIQLIKLIGLNFFMEVAPGSLGIRDKMAKFSRKMSSFPTEKSENKSMISALTNS